MRTSIIWPPASGVLIPSSTGHRGHQHHIDCKSFYYQVLIPSSTGHRGHPSPLQPGHDPTTCGGRRESEPHGCGSLGAPLTRLAVTALHVTGSILVDAVAGVIESDTGSPGYYD